LDQLVERVPAPPEAWGIQHPVGCGWYPFSSQKASSKMKSPQPKCTTPCGVQLVPCWNGRVGELFLDLWGPEILHILKWSQMACTVIHGVQYAFWPGASPDWVAIPAKKHVDVDWWMFIIDHWWMLIDVRMDVDIISDLNHWLRMALSTSLNQPEPFSQPLGPSPFSKAKGPLLSTWDFSRCMPWVVVEFAGAMGKRLKYLPCRETSIWNEIKDHLSRNL
jgi:hypothetical protein